MKQVAVLDPLPVFALVTDRAGKIRWLNKHNLDANGVKRRALIGKRPADVWPESAADTALDLEVRRTRRPVSHIAFGRTRTGRPVWLKVTRSPLPGGQLLVVGVEVTEGVKFAAHKLWWKSDLGSPLADKLLAISAGGWVPDANNIARYLTGPSPQPRTR